MKIVIHYDEGEWPIETDNPHEQSLDELLDTFTAAQVPTILNAALRSFRGMCDLWNQREMEARRNLNLDAETSPATEE